MEDMFLTADINQLVSLSNVDRHDDSHVLRAATDYVWQWRLASWTAQQNDKGITPPTSLVLDQWAKNRMAVPMDLRPPYWGSTALASARMRALRWRRKFGGRIGAIRVRQHTPVDVMQSKVSSLKMVYANARQRSYINHTVPINQSPIICLTRCSQPRNLHAARGAKRVAFSARPRFVIHARQTKEILNKSGLDFRYGKRT